jgi:hypothetical protein
MRVSAAYLERVGKDWQHAFAEAHGKPAPEITFANGWYRIENGRIASRYRRSQLEQMTKVLRKGFDD